MALRAQAGPPPAGRAAPATLGRKYFATMRSLVIYGGAAGPRVGGRPAARRSPAVCSAAAAAPDPSATPQQPPQPAEPQTTAVEDVRLSPYHYVAFFVMLAGGLVFVAALLYFTVPGIEFQRAMFKSCRRLLKTFALKQVATILSAMAFVKYGLEPVIKTVRTLTKAQGPWEKSSEYYLLREVRPAGPAPPRTPPPPPPPRQPTPPALCCLFSLSRCTSPWSSSSWWPPSPPWARTFCPR